MLLWFFFPIKNVGHIDVRSHRVFGKITPRYDTAPYRQYIQSLSFWSHSLTGSVCLSLCLSIYPPTHPHPSMHPFIYPSIHPPVRPSIHPSMHLIFIDLNEVTICFFNKTPPLWILFQRTNGVCQHLAFGVTGSGMLDRSDVKGETFVLVPGFRDFWTILAGQEAESEARAGGRYNLQRHTRRDCFLSQAPHLTDATDLKWRTRDLGGGDISYSDRGFVSL